MTLNNQRKAQEISLQSQQLALNTRQAQFFMQMFSKQTSKDAFEYVRVLWDHQYSTQEECEALMEKDMEFKILVRFTNSCDKLLQMMERPFINV